MSHVNLGITRLAHLHILVDDIDEAAAFYREVMGFIEMQSHYVRGNRGLATYYGYKGDPESLEARLRFMFLPEALTIKLVKFIYHGYAGSTSPYESAGGPAVAKRGAGPYSIEVSDLDAAYKTLVAKVRDYGSRFKFQLLSPPTFLSPLFPHEVGTTSTSAIHGNQELLDAYVEAFHQRAKFALLDPFGIHWEFNNEVDHPDT